MNLESQIKTSFFTQHSFQTLDFSASVKNSNSRRAANITKKIATTSKSWNENLTLASTAGSGTGAMIDNAINALQISLGLSMSRSKSDTNSTTYNNSTIIAESGNITLTSINDTDIKGANILSQNTILNVGNNLSVESKQNSHLQKAKSFGLNLGGGGGTSSGASGSLGVNYSSNKTDRVWTDNQTSIIGTNSIEINTANNSKIIGAVIANSTNGTIGNNSIDGGNLTLNTNSLTFQNLNDHYYTSQFGAGLSTSIGAGLNGNASNPMQNLNFYPNSSTTLSLQNSSYKKEGLTQATIGQGTINITDNSDITNLNRDIAKSQIIAKDQITGALDVSVTIDNRLLTSAGRNQMIQEQKNLPKNMLINAVQLSELVAVVPGSPVWTSRVIDGNNDEIKNGEPVKHPAPNLWPGNPLDKNDTPTVGRNDQECRNNSFCRNSISDEAYHLQALYYGIPGFKSASQFHDAATTNSDGTEKSGVYKFISIFPYFPVNYYGAIGTILDAKNWNQNSPQNSNNSNSVFGHDK